MAELQTTSHPIKLSINDCPPSVCIGMPVYNGAEYIHEALDSLLVQTFADFNLIISDNASTDETQAICEEYARRDPRIHYVRQKQNNGALANFKFVLECADAKLFMWAAYDDVWAPNFLMDATASLTDETIDFVFPTFELRSIRLGLARKISPEIFRFVESPDRKWRVLHFMALHYLSHSANIVYSLFRTQFLRDAWVQQDISNDGVLGAVVLSRGRGAMSNSLFSKRYRMVWPGMLPPKIGIVKGWLRRRDINREVVNAIKAAKLHMLTFFPEYEREIIFIFERYRSYEHDRNYRICSIRDLF